MSAVRLFVVLGSSSAFLGVAFGAFAAHLLKEKLSADQFAVFEVGVRYHLIHALALFAAAWCSAQFPESRAETAGWLFAAGTVLFSGSLYLLSLTGIRWLGAVTPFGGFCFLAGWAVLAWSVFRSPA